MDKTTEEKINERLKSEGDLIRNSGTNSIKAVRTDLAKFHDVFQSINMNMIEQTKILRETLDFHMGIDRRNERAQQLEEAKRTASEQKEKTTGRRDGPSDSLGGTGGAEQGRFGLASLFGAGGLGAGIGAVAALYRKVIGGGLLIAAAPVISSLLNDAVTESLSKMDFTPEMASSFGEAAGLAGLWGAIGLAFGRRFGLAGALGGALASLSDEILDAIGIDPNEQMNIFGIEFSAGAGATGLLAAIGATVGLLAPSLLSLTGTLLAGVLTGPVGLAAITGAAIAGTVILIEKWLENKRTEYLQELEAATAGGLGNTSRITTEDSPNIIRRLQLRFGAQAQTPGEELAALIQQIERTGRISDSDAMIGMGETAPRTLTEEQSRSAEGILRNILNVPEGADMSSFDFSQIDLSNLSGGLLNDIRRASEMLGLDGLITRLDDATSIVERTAELQKRISALNAERQTIEETSATSSIPLSQSQVIRLDEISNEISELSDTLMGVRGYSIGTKGFEDFGRGSFAVLHGREAVVPETTPAGQFLQNFFDENWQPTMARLNEVSAAAVGQTANSINYTPVTIAPVTSNNVRGGSNVTTITSITTRSAELDALARPGGVH